MTETTAITLGGRAFPVAPITLGRMRTVAPAFTRIGIDTPDGMAAQITVIHAAVSAADPSVKLEDLDALTGVTFEELKAAVETISVMIGLGKKAPAPGEAAAPRAAPEQA